jgi:hypothetical protein
MAGQHKTRDSILAVLQNADRPLTPKQVSDAPPDVGYAAVRKLMRSMQHGQDTDLIPYQEKPNGPYDLLKRLDESRINAAPQVVLHAQLIRVINGDRRQRHTHPNDINEVLRRLLRESEASIHKVVAADIDKIEINIVLPPKRPEPESTERHESKSITPKPKASARKRKEGKAHSD